MISKQKSWFLDMVFCSRIRCKVLMVLKPLTELKKFSIFNAAIIQY